MTQLHGLLPIFAIPLVTLLLMTVASICFGFIAVCTKNERRRTTAIKVLSLFLRSRDREIPPQRAPEGRPAAESTSSTELSG